MNNLIAKQFKHKGNGNTYIVKEMTTIKIDGEDIEGVVYFKEGEYAITYTRTVVDFLDKFEEVKP